MKAEITRAEAIAGFLYNPITGELNNSKGDECGSVSHNGYLRIWVKGRSMAAQRLIWLYMTGELPAGDIDHINHDRLDNRWINLRMVSRQGNMKNAKRSSASASGFTGVTWCKQQGQWQSQVCVAGKTKKLGRFDCKLDAIAARIRANKHYSFHANHGGA